MNASPDRDDAASEALLAVLAESSLAGSLRRKLLWLNASDCFALHESRQPHWVLQQDFRPVVDRLRHQGATVRELANDETFDLVCITPPRQRERMRALFAIALEHLAPGGAVFGAVANNLGARSAAADFSALYGEVEIESRRKCRVFHATPGVRVDRALAAAWRALDDMQPILDGAWISRPGLFAWDRIDAASALLAEHLPEDLAGDVADLGAGFGYLSVETLRRCPRVEAIDLHEADARALQPARINLERAIAARATPARFEICWTDVTAGLEHRYDAIVMNPPFHTDRRDRPELGRAFIERAADALRPRGRLLLVANRHLPYEATLDARFATRLTLADRDGYKVIAAAGPRSA